MLSSGYGKTLGKIDMCRALVVLKFFFYKCFVSTVQINNALFKKAAMSPYAIIYRLQRGRSTGM